MSAVIDAFMGNYQIEWKLGSQEERHSAAIDGYVSSCQNR
jgi:hypothetical protein